MTRRGGRRAQLSRSSIAEAALQLIDAHGASAFTVTSLSDRLGVRAPSLYNHVSSRADIIELVRELVCTEIDASAFTDKPWDMALTDWATSYRRAFGSHPNTIEILSFNTIRAPGVLAMYEQVVRGLIRAGWGQHHVLTVMMSVEAFVLGCALDLSAPEEMISLEGMDAAFPELTSVIKAAEDSPPRTDLMFSSGLSAMIKGLQAQLAEVSNELTNMSASDRGPR